jgi:hypothetical protein
MLHQPTRDVLSRSHHGQDPSNSQRSKRSPHPFMDAMSYPTSKRFLMWRIVKATRHNMTRQHPTISNLQIKS